MSGFMARFRTTIPAKPYENYRWRNNMKTIAKICMVAVGLVLFSLAAFAGDVTIPNTFTAGTTAKAAEVNANFAAVEAAVDDNDARIDTLVSTAAIKNGALQTNLNADMLDGLHEAAFFRLDENETVNGIPAFNGGTSGSTAPFSVDSNTKVTNLNADLLDGIDSTAFASSSHWHYFLNASDGSPTNALYLDTAGNVGIGTTTPTEKLHVNGNVKATSIKYNSARTHYYTIGGEGFNPASDVAFGNSWGMGGAYISSGTGVLVAPVHLPHGAIVTSFKVFFNTNAALTVGLQCIPMASGSYYTMASVTSTAGGYNNATDTTISSATVDNTNYSYHIRAYNTAWSSSLVIMGAVITYTISEAD
jgi:hypothetical protein